MLKTFFQPLIAWYLAALKTAGYPVIVLLMTMESSFLPLPSEVIIPPAAHLADTGQIPLGFAGIVVAGVFGSWLGATIMYWLARFAGRPLVLRFGKFVLFPPEKLANAERWMSPPTRNRACAAPAASPPPPPIDPASPPASRGWIT